MTRLPATAGPRIEISSIATRFAAPLALGLGALAATGFAPLDLWPLTLVALAAWMALVHAAPGLRQALWRGWLFGVGHFAVGNVWMQHPFAYQDAMPQWFGYGAVVLIALYLALYPMIAAGLAWRFGGGGRGIESPPGGRYALMFGAAWILTEWLRATLFTGYPWNPIAVIWVPTAIAAAAALTGTYALSGLTIAAAGSLVAALRRRWSLAATAAAIAVLAALSSVPPPRPDPGAATRPLVRIVQANLGEEVRPTDDYAENSLRALEALGGRPGPRPRLIVWPEGALRYLVEDGYPADYYWRATGLTVRRRIAAGLGPHDVVLTGGNALLFDGAGAVRAETNSIFAIDAGARLLARYDKAHLVPFGEYLPFRPVFSALGLQRLVPGDIDFAAGPGRRTIVLPGFGAVGMDICYEIIFSGKVIDRAHRPALIFNPSNDSWFGAWGPPQHLAQARLRAIEEGVPIIRATPTGISAVIDADGRLLATIGLHRAGAIEVPVPPAHPPTLFARAGNWIALAVMAAMLLLGVAMRRPSR